MLNTSDIDSLIGGTVYDNDHDKIGTIEQIYVDAADGHPSWAAVRTGLFGTKSTFVPLDDADASADEIRVPYEKAKVKDAPRVDADQELSEAEVDELYRYYELGTADASHGYTGPSDADLSRDSDAGPAGTGSTAAGSGYDTTDTASRTGDRSGEVGGPGHDTSGPNTDDAMTRSEERLHVGTERVQTGRARLRKYVVTEDQQVTVPVSHEEVRLEREPITEGNVGDALDGPAISEEEHEVTLSAERPVVEKEAVPVERVRLGTDTVTEQQQVNEQVRKEQVDLDGDGVADERGSDDRL